MGSIQTKPDIVLQQTLESEVVDDDTWLDTLVHDLATALLSPARQNEVRDRLAGIPFAAILCAMDRARPQLTPVTEITLYEHWIACTATGPLTCAAWFNIGVLHGALGNRFASALAYRKALNLRPDMYSAAVNLGLLQEAAGQPDNALDTWKRADQPDEARIALGIQQGRLLEKTGRLLEAEQALRRVLLTSTDQPDVVHHWVHIRQKTCLWPVTPSDIPGLPPETLLKSAGPLSILAMTDDIDLQREAAGAWIARKTAPAPRRLAPTRPYDHQRIRIGYVSSDFCNHAMSYLITELFERHDRTRFEVFGYCSSAEDGSDLRKRVLAAFDHCRLIRDLADEQAAQVIRADEIDILVDLNGITDGSRLGVLRWRPAPIQATYLGFIGPLPMPELDYMLADSIAIPPEHETDYQPAPLAIARSYQANDSRRTIGPKLTRAQAGLPEDAFVLCCFCRHYKVTEAMFGAWMDVMRQSPRAVLWLAKDNAFSEASLLQAASRAGVDQQRLIFCERADADLYLSRLGVADLFIDTFPYNAGTVASDAIRMQLPLVTLCGRSFASRMATSLLHAIGAPQGITTSMAKYVAKVVRFANDPAAYAAYKAHFTSDVWSQTIGDIATFTAEYEATWTRIIASRTSPT